MVERLAETKILREAFLKNRLRLSEMAVDEVLNRFPFLPPVVTMETSLLNLEKRGISREEVNAIVVKFPLILGHTAERTNALLDIFERYDIKFLTKPYRLILPPGTIKERIKRMEEVDLDVSNFQNALFTSKTNFEKFIQRHPAS